MQGVREGITAEREAVREVSPSGDTRQRLQLDAVLRAVPTDPGGAVLLVPQVLTGASAEERQRSLDTPRCASACAWSSAWDREQQHRVRPQAGGDAPALRGRVLGRPLAQLILAG